MNACDSTSVFPGWLILSKRCFIKDCRVQTELHLAIDHKVREMETVDWNGLFQAVLKEAKSTISGCYVLIVLQRGYYIMIPN